MTTALAILMIILSNCASTPLPDDLVILPPDGNVPAELAKISGGWKGFIRDDQTTRDIRVIFSRIGGAEDIDLIYSYSSAVSTKRGNRNYGDADYQRLKAKFTNGQVSAKTKGGNIVSFMINPDGSDTLVETFTGGKSLTTVLERISPEDLNSELAKK
jgi:hypothetical protein